MRPSRTSPMAWRTAERVPCLAVRQHRAGSSGKSLLERPNLAFTDLSRSYGNMGVGKLLALRDRTVLRGAGLTRFLAVRTVVHDCCETLRLRTTYVLGGELRPDVKSVGNLFHEAVPYCLMEVVQADDS